MLRRDDDVRINIVSELPHAAGEGEDRISTQALCSQSRLFGFFRLFLKKHRCFSLFLSLSFQEFGSDIPSHGSIGRSFRADMEDGRLDFIPVILIVIRKEYFALSCLCLIRWIGALIEENTACIHDVLDISKVSGLFVYLRCGRSHGKTDTVRYMLPADDVSGMLDIFQKPPCAPPMKTAEIGIRPFWLISFPSWMTTEGTYWIRIWDPCTFSFTKAVHPEALPAAMHMTASSSFLNS